MADKKLIYLVDRSGVETDDTCGMKYWWNRLEGKKGIVRKEEEFYFLIGRETHEDLAHIAQAEDISPSALSAMVDEIIGDLNEEDRSKQKEMEVLYRRLGWMVAFALYVEPRIRARYETIQIEGELILDRSPLWVAVTPDRVLRDRGDGALVYKEYKTTISASQKWANSWPYQIQPHIGMKAIEEELKQKVRFTQIVGLMKGDIRDGKLRHPYVWAWRNSETGHWTHDYNQARSSAWESCPVWLYPGGIVEWVERCGEEVGQAQFPHSAPVFLNERMLSDWFERVLHRQEEIEAVREACQNEWEWRIRYFPQRTSKCRPAWGEACPYLEPCWIATIGEQPLESGLFKERVPHHEAEIILEEKESV